MEDRKIKLSLELLSLTDSTTKNKTLPPQRLLEDPLLLSRLNDLFITASWQTSTGPYSLHLFAQTTKNSLKTIQENLNLLMEMILSCMFRIILYLVPLLQIWL